jgi:hypothetical protein
MKQRLTVELSAKYPSKLLRPRSYFALEALSSDLQDLFFKLLEENDPLEQELLWSCWIEYFFQEGKISWEGMASVPLLQEILLKENHSDSLPLWDYLLYLAGQVEYIYFYYDRNEGPSYQSEAHRWKDVRGREEVRPWLRLAFHSLIEYVHFFEQKLKAARKKEKEFVLRFLGLVLSMGHAPVESSTRQTIFSWQKKHLDKSPLADESPNQLGLFQAI